MEALEYNIFEIDFFENINSYKQSLTISQVIKYFEKYGLVIPKTTIQNLVRNGVIAEVVDKRYYTKLHILQIFIFYAYKECFLLSEMKKINLEIFNECNNREIDLVFYEIFELNNNLEDFDSKGNYLDIIYLMTKCVNLKNDAIKKLDEIKLNF